jgi:hypothetical protein
VLSTPRLARATEDAGRHSGTRAWRLASGCVLLADLSSHLATHLLGFVSLATAQAGLRVTVAVWRSVPGTVALAAAFAIHLALALRTLATRRRLPGHLAGAAAAPDGAAAATGAARDDGRGAAAVGGRVRVDDPRARAPGAGGASGAGRRACRRTRRMA